MISGGFLLTTGKELEQQFFKRDALCPVSGVIIQRESALMYGLCFLLTDALAVKPAAVYPNMEA